MSSRLGSKHPNIQPYHVLPNNVHLQSLQDLSTRSATFKDDQKYSHELVSTFDLDADPSPKPVRQGFWARIRPFKKNISIKGTKIKFWGFRGLLWRVIFPALLLAVMIAFAWGVYREPLLLADGIDPNTYPAVKGLWTTFLIVYLFLAFIPLNDAVSDVKSEEFFRLIAVPGVSGKTIEAVNEISSLNHGILDQSRKFLRGQSTRYVVVALFVGAFGLIISATGPGMLSVDNVYYDSDLYALEVGAVPPGSIWDTATEVTQLIFDPTNGNNRQNLSRGGLLAWAKTSFDIDFSLSGPENVIVPLPTALETSDVAYYLTDVAILNPECTWNAPVNARTVNPRFGLYDTEAELGSDLLVQFTAPETDVDFNVVNWDQIFNTTTSDVASSGVSVFVLGRGPRTSLNLDNIPTSPVTNDANQTFDVSLLLCNPHATVSTRQIFADGSGNLGFADDKEYPTRGNMHPQQVNILLALLTQTLSMDAGPITPLSKEFGVLSGEGLMNIAFGPSIQTEADVQNIPTLTPLPPSNISSMYTASVIAASKGFVDGHKVGSAFVPARIVKIGPGIVSAFPQIILATCLWFLMVLLLVYVYFRPPSRPFVFTTVAASLAGSNVPQEVLRKVPQSTIWTAEYDKQVVKEVGKRELYFDDVANAGKNAKRKAQPGVGVIRMAE